MDFNLSLTHLGLSLAAGSLTTLSPCVFPLLPLVAGGATTSSPYAPLAMGAGMVTAFVALGLILGAVGHALGIDSDTVRQAGGWLLIVLAIVMLSPAANAGLGNLITPLSNGAARLAHGVPGTSLSGAFLLGTLLGAVWSPCSGPLLASALTLVATEGGALRGGAILGLFGLGAAIPLMVVAYASRRGFERIKGSLMVNMEGIKKVFALLIAFMGLTILMGWDKRLEAWVTGFLPEWWINLTVGI